MFHFSLRFGSALTAAADILWQRFSSVVDFFFFSFSALNLYSLSPQSIIQRENFSMGKTFTLFFYPV